MLLELRVKDPGIIEDIDWKPDQGLNVITGETGAGKSLVIDAVELLLTGTASDHPPGSVPGGQSRRSSGKKA